MYRGHILCYRFGVGFYELHTAEFPFISAHSVFQTRSANEI